MELSSTLDKDAGKSDLRSDLHQAFILAGVGLASGPDKTVSFIHGGYTGSVEPHLEAPLGELRGFLGECGLLAQEGTYVPGKGGLIGFDKAHGPDTTGEVILRQDGKVALRVVSVKLGRRRKLSVLERRLMKIVAECRASNYGLTRLSRRSKAAGAICDQEAAERWMAGVWGHVGSQIQLAILQARESESGKPSRKSSRNDVKEAR